MVDWIREHFTNLVGGAALLVAGWWALTTLLRRRASHGMSMRVTAYCMHCNWEGPVTMSNLRCGRCRSTNMSVLSTGTFRARS